MSFILLVNISCLKKIAKHFRKNPSETLVAMLLPFFQELAQLFGASILVGGGSVINGAYPV
jgi:hypothetical protein